LLECRESLLFVRANDEQLIELGDLEDLTDLRVDAVQHQSSPGRLRLLVGSDELTQRRAGHGTPRSRSLKAVSSMPRTVASSPRSWPGASAPRAERKKYLQFGNQLRYWQKYQVRGEKLTERTENRGLQSSSPRAYLGLFSQDRHGNFIRHFFSP